MLLRHLFVEVHPSQTLVDLFIVRKIGDQGTFVEKLKKLEQAGFLSAKNRELLDAALNAGHAAAHRAYLPKREQLWTVMDIVENLLQSDLLAKEMNNRGFNHHTLRRYFISSAPIHQKEILCLRLID